MKPLTVEEIRTLPQGTEVVVTWAGGNGPHTYTIDHQNGGVYARTEMDEMFNLPPDRHRDLLHFIGDAPPFTVVRLAAAAPAASA